MAQNMNEESVEQKVEKKQKKETGIIYLSRIPTLMNVAILRNHFEKFGEIGRMFLQPDLRAKNRGKRTRIFSEGWVEFKDKKNAKAVAACLNNTEIGGKKKSKWREELWNIKYLHKFKWAHLNERLSYEKAVHSQRMRAEISQAKREANFYIENAEKNEAQKRFEKKKKKSMQAGKDKEQILEEDESGALDNNHERIFTVRLKDTEEDILKKRKLNEKKTDASKRFQSSDEKKSFLTKLFTGGVGADSDEDD